MHRNAPKVSSHNIVSITETKTDTFNFIPSKKIERCTKHSTKKLKFYCDSCSELICSHCLHSIHKGHTYELMEDVFQKHKEELVSGLEPLREMMEKVEQASCLLTLRENEVRNRKAKLENNIRKEINELHKLLDQRGAKLFADLDLRTQDKLKKLSLQMNLAETTKTIMSSCLEYAETGLETGSEGEVLRMKGPILKRIEEITAEFDPDTLQPKIEDDIELVTSNRAHEACQEFGDVTSYNTISADSSYATGDGTHFAMEGTNVFVEVHPMTAKKEVICEQKFNLTAQLVHTKTGATIKCTAKQENGRHVITYQPVSRGRHDLYIRINGRQIKGSPYPIAVIPLLESLPRPVKVIYGLKRSWGVAVTSKRYILVAEHGRHCISVLTPDGQKVMSFGAKGTENGHLHAPRGVTTDHHDNIYVADKNNHRIQKFTPEGKFVAAVGSKGSNSLQFNQPVYVCFNKTNHLLYVCDQENHRIQVLTTDFTFVRSFGTKGSNDGEFQNPKQAAFDNDCNNFYVTDWGNHQVQVFTAEGEFLRSFYEKADGNTLEKPYALGIDSNDTVYVSEFLRQNVSVFTPQGKYITSFGEPGFQDRQFNEVRGICIDHNNALIVSDSCNNAIKIF